MCGLAERVQQRRSAAPSRRLWAGPFCSSRRPSRSASHESGREGWKRAGRVGWLAAHYPTRRGGASAARRARFCCILPAMRFLLLAPREGARFAGGLARCGGELYFLHSFEFWAPRLSFDPRCTGQIRNHGFFLSPIQITPVHRCVPRLHSTTEMREPILDRIGRLVVGSIQL